MKAIAATYKISTALSPPEFIIGMADAKMDGWMDAHRTTV